MLFGAAGVGGRTRIHALMTRSTAGLRALLSGAHGLGFAAPLLPADADRRAETDQVGQLCCAAAQEQSAVPRLERRHEAVRFTLPAFQHSAACPHPHAPLNHAVCCAAGRLPVAAGL